mgnify:CR=1 FL=1
MNTQNVENKENITYIKSVSDFLNEIKEITGGKSLAANIQLVLNNARLASRIAGELTRLR